MGTSNESEYLTLAQVSKIAPGRPHCSAIWRWCRKGLKARTGQIIRLAHIRAGHRLFIKPSDLEEFFRKVAEADTAHFDTPTTPPILPAPKGRTARQKQRDIERAERMLAKAGV